MKNEKVRALILRNALFATATLLATSAVNLTDAYFLSTLGTSATAAAGVAFAVQFLLQAIGFTVGMGGGSLLSRAMGAQNEEECRRSVLLSVLLALLIGGVLAAVGNLMIDRLLPLLGATESIYHEARVYLRLLLLSAPFLCLSLVLSQLLRAAGNVILSTVGFISGGVINLALTPLLLFHYHLGIAGAGLAILIGHAVSSLSLFLLTRHRYSRIRISLCRLPLRDVSRLLRTGLPSFFRHGLSGVATLSLNHLVRPMGAGFIAAVTVVSRISLLSLSFCTGIGQGMIPVAGYYYGAKKYDLVRRAYRFSTVLASLVSLGIAIPVFALAPALMTLFRADAEVAQIGASALRAQCTVFVLHGFITTTTMLLQTIGKTTASTVLAAARQGIFFLPLLFLFPSQFRYLQPTADLLTFLLGLWIRFRVARKGHPLHPQDLSKRK